MLERNICIYGELQSLYEQNLNTIVFACSLKHTKLLHKICILTGMKVGKIDDKEIDFIATRREEKYYIQVSYMLSTKETRDRELLSFSKIMDHFIMFLRQQY